MKQRLVLVLLMLPVINGCSTIYFHRGLSPNAEKVNRQAVYKVDHRHTHNISGNSAGTVRVMYKKRNAIILFSSTAQKEDVLSFGPWVLLPFPIIPWPFGIFNAIRNHSPDATIPKAITISIEVVGPPGKSFLFDPSTVQVRTEPDIELKQVWEIGKFEGDKFVRRSTDHEEAFSQAASFNLSLFPFDEKIQRIFLQLDRLIIDNEPVSVPPITFVRGSGIGIYMGVVNE